MTDADREKALLDVINRRLRRMGGEGSEIYERAVWEYIGRFLGIMTDDSYPYLPVLPDDPSYVVQPGGGARPQAPRTCGKPGHAPDCECWSFAG